MTDRELLEMAAKAAGYELWVYQPLSCFCLVGTHDEWNPLTDDGDALRLAVKLKLQLEWDDNGYECAIVSGIGMINPCTLERFNSDPYAATRRAIVRAASEIGKEMQ